MKNDSSQGGPLAGLRIIDITESAVKLKELIQDSGNDWKEEERLMLLHNEQEARK